MSELIATIFHITDMHLHVDAQGGMRPERHRSARLLAAIAHRVPVPALRSLFAGIMWHNEEALLALAEMLPDLARAEQDQYQAPVVVLQGGDVEALGSASLDGAGYAAFPSFEFLHRQIRDANRSWTWIDIYGNHDTWPGTYPTMRWRHRGINRQRVATVPGLHGPWPDVTEIASGPAGIPVLVARVNTVSRTLLEETLASGRVSDHPPAGSTLEQVLDDLERQFVPWRGQPAVRVVSMHHPPHAFGSASTKLTTGLLLESKPLAERLSGLGVHLVAAGHLHVLNPEFDGPNHPPQPPLRAPTHQLVAESPTQDAVEPPDDDNGYEELPRRSFSRYRLWTDGSGVSIERTVFSYSDQRGGFAATQTRSLFGVLPLV